MGVLKRLQDWLLDRLERPHRRGQPADLRWLRRQFRVRARDAVMTGPEGRSSAARMRDLRVAILMAIGPVDACCSCAVGHPPPNGRYPGGYCCGGVTDALFTAAEIAALRASGTRSWHLRAPRGVDGGCIFRGPTGCGLSPAHRPSKCVTYLCNDLSRDLAAKGRLEQVEALCKDLEREMRGFEALYFAREAEILIGFGAREPHWPSRQG